MHAAPHGSLEDQTAAAKTGILPLGKEGTRSRRRDLLELSIGYGLILVVLWTPPPWQRAVYLLAAAFLFGASLRPGEDWRGLGFSSRNLLASSSILLLAIVLATASTLFARRCGTLHAPASLAGFVHRFWGYILWSFAQQFLLQNFFLLRLRRLLPGRTTLAVSLAATIFAAAHLPNPILTIFTLVWGLIACAAFMRFRSLYALSISHAVLGMGVAICLPGAVTHNMRVGLGYLHFGRAHGVHHRSSSDHTVSTSV